MVYNQASTRVGWPDDLASDGDALDRKSESEEKDA
jgi:hypothetical protein